jgi:hypothetical protein
VIEDLTDAGMWHRSLFNWSGTRDGFHATVFHRLNGHVWFATVWVSVEKRPGVRALGEVVFRAEVRGSRFDAMAAADAFIDREAEKKAKVA